MGQGRGFGRGGVLIPDTLLVESRLKTFMDLPWVLPPAVLMEITDEDLDNLGAAGPGEYWSVLNAVVRRIQEKEAS
jgi:hypothetical protein